eukprot:4527630-Lingulodinium_polyedra.AAC.1
MMGAWHLEYLGTHTRDCKLHAGQTTAGCKRSDWENGNINCSTRNTDTRFNGGQRRCMSCAFTSN